ncbi:hypothetical protein GQ44DRAFT_765478 [Phaeosphaeriaceae sp. PMI808]|nr:hypothetical protein GQ44DRAFT_765478 [Phaeosphaeriaceae sp. PMI808]
MTTPFGSAAGAGRQYLGISQNPPASTPNRQSMPLSQVQTSGHDSDWTQPVQGQSNIVDDNQSKNQSDHLAYGSRPPPLPTSKDKNKGLMNRLKKTLEPEHERLAGERDVYRDQRDEYAQWCTIYQSQVQELNDKLASAQDSVNRTKRSANQMQTTMDNKELFLGVQAHDDDIHTKFGSIVSSIKTLSSHFSAGSSHAFHEGMLREYQMVAPRISNISDLENLISNKRRKRLFARGWAAYIMSVKLFRTFDPVNGELGEDVWLHHNLAENLADLEVEFWYTDRKAISYREFNDWRAFTAELLSKALVNEPHKAEEQMRKSVEKAVRDVMDIITPWCDASDPEVLQTYEVDFNKLFTSAAHLAHSLRRQRALWSIRFPSFPKMGLLMFDPVCMKDDRGDDEDMNPDLLKQQCVEIVITPALYKRGTMNGLKFESEEAAVPAVVTIDPN